MENKTLEIKVYDTVTAYDVFGEAVKAVADIIQKWFVSDEEKPLTITIGKMNSRAPPVLKINVNDSVSAEGGLV